MIDRKKAPVFNAISSIDFIAPQKQLMDNGVPVYSISGGSQDILKIDFIFNAGAGVQKKPLIAKATNSLMKEGTQHYSSHEIAEGIDQFGAYIQTESGFDKAHVTIYTLSKHLSKVLPFVQEVLFSPSFDAREFTTYQQNEWEHFKIKQEKVSFLARNEFMKQLFGPTHPYGKIAVQQDFENLQLADIKEHHALFYGMNNCEILVSGKIDPTTFDSLHQFFGTVDTAADPKKANPTYANTITTSKIYIEKKNALQSAIRIGKLMPNKTHPDYFKLQILNTVLGGYFGSRLMKNIREDKGYTYGIGSGILSLQNSGYFYISTEVGADLTQKALDEIYKEIALLQSNLIGNDELLLVKNYLLGSLLKSSDGPFKMGALFENVHCFGFDFEFYNRYIKTIKSVTAAELMATANQYFKRDSLSEIVAGKLA